MNRQVIALLVAGILIAGAAIVLLFVAPGSEESAEFNAYEEGETAAQNIPSISAAPRVGERPTVKPLARKGSDDEILKLPDDELNRPGPTGDAAEARRIKNRRPRTDEDPGKQEDLPAGNLDKADVQEGIQAVRPLVKVCYEETLEEFPEAAGKVTMGFRIIGEDGKGRVEMTELAEDGTTLFDQKLHDCMQKSIAEAEFDTPSGGGVVNVRYPFVFESDSDE